MNGEIILHKPNYRGMLRTLIESLDKEEERRKENFGNNESFEDYEDEEISYHDDDEFNQYYHSNEEEEENYYNTLDPEYDEYDDGYLYIDDGDYEGNNREYLTSEMKNETLESKFLEIKKRGKKASENPIIPKPDDWITEEEPITSEDEEEDLTFN